MPALTPLRQAALLVLGTLASEDLTCVAAGLLVRTGRLSLSVGLAGCFVGIVAGDLGLWVLGRLAGAALLPRGRLDALAAWLDRRGGAAVLASRFLPGARLPLYLAAGAVGLAPGRFALWTALAALLWVPLIVGAAALLGEPAARLVGSGWPALPLGALALAVVLRVALLAATARGRARLARLRRWELWPTWLAYLPLLPWLAWLSLRHRGLLVWTAANPGIPHGGVVGESKHAILSRLPPEAVIPSFLVPPGEAADRLARCRAALADNGWAFPLILKPDASQRGAGVRRARDLVEVEKYLLAQPAAVLVQPYHPGPFEAGVFYYRLPGEETGHIFSITDKVFPVLVGDGRSTVEELIWRHPRYRLQADVFLARLDARRNDVLADGEALPLALAGNHCQGTLFRDGGHLLTPELERAVDAVARRFDGFFIGRFDIRYTDREAFKAGRDLAIVELNGATSESTNVYDPSWPL
jgi:membrane protein DedA with SNARE-associated domain